MRFTRLIILLMSCMLALAPLPLMAEVYKCKQDGKTTYSTSPCSGKPVPVATELSITPAYQPAQPTAGAGSSGGQPRAPGMDGTDVVTLMLLLLVPLSFAVIFFMSRKSETRTRPLPPQQY